MFNTVGKQLQCGVAHPDVFRLSKVTCYPGANASYRHRLIAIKLAGCSMFKVFFPRYEIVT